MLHYLPSLPRVQGQQPLQTKERQHLQFEQFSVLARSSQIGNNNKEVLISVRTPETQSQLVQIHLKPSQSSNARAEVQVEDFKGSKQVQLSKSQSADFYNDYIQMYLLPNGEVKVEIKDAFYVIYDGAHVKITVIDQKFYGSVQGLCGTFTGDYYNDFLAPRNCILGDAQEFIQSYTLSHGQKQSSKAKCYPDEIRAGDYISNKDADRSTHRSQSSSQSNKHQQQSLKKGCTAHKHLYVDGQEPNTICFSIRKMPSCKQECQPIKTVEKNVKVFCVAKSETTSRWVNQIDNGNSPSFSLKEGSKAILMQVAVGCHRA